LEKITEENLKSLTTMVSKSKDSLATFIVEVLNACAYGSGAILDLSKEWAQLNQIIGSIKHANLRHLDKNKLRNYCIETKGGSGVIDFDGASYKKFMAMKPTKPFLEPFFKVLQRTLYLASLQLRSDDLKAKIAANTRQIRANNIRIKAFHDLAYTLPQFMVVTEASRIEHEELTHLRNKAHQLMTRKAQLSDELHHYEEHYFGSHNH
jgi:uncharacterized protein YeeX (DUF496 family)